MSSELEGSPVRRSGGSKKAKYSHAVQTKLAKERPVRSHFEWAGINGGTLFTFFLPQIECRTVDAHGIVANKY